jgi:pyruvate dehydrogenase E2 component (dihydrolipoamide acetyltransferase)
MPINILMPALSPTMEKGNLAKWLKKEGDKIKSGDVIAEIETDKATMEVEAVDEGVLAKIVIPAGTQDVAVNQLIGLIAGDGEDAKSVGVGGSSALPSSAPPPSPQGGGKLPTAQAAPSSPSMGEVAAKAASGGGADGSRPFASPLAKRIAKDAGIDLARVAGSGPHGRIVAVDIEAAKAGGAARAPLLTPAAPPSPQGGAISAPSDDKTKLLFAPGSYEEIPHDGMRKTIARRLTESKQTVPHFYLTADCDIDALLSLREQVNRAAPVSGDKPAYKVSVNDMVIKALALALRRVPDANVSWTDGVMLKHKVVDVGVAVSIPGGLITPIVRNADTLSLSAISNAMKDLAGRAKNKKLAPTEYQGGSTAVSNLGMFGVKNFSAVINPPHATILAVGAGEKRPIVKADGTLGIATLMSVTLSTDHRAVDGALGAELLQAFRQIIENPISMVV